MAVMVMSGCEVYRLLVVLEEIISMVVSLLSVTSLECWYLLFAVTFVVPMVVMVVLACWWWC